MKFNKYIVFLIILLINISGLHSFDYEVIDLQRGLTQNSVYDIFQDKNGFIWMATSDGLCRFDGINVKVYKHNENDSNSITDNFIHTIIEDKNRDLWIASGKGLNYYSTTTGLISSFPYPNESNFALIHLYYAGGDLLLITSFVKGEFISMMFNIKSHSYDLTPLDFNFDNTFYYNFIQSKNSTYLVKNNEFFTYKTDASQLLKLNNIEYSKDINFSKCIDNYLILAGSNGWISFYDIRTLELLKKINLKLGDDYVSSVVIDNYGRFWIGTKSKSGIIILEKDFSIFKQFLPSQDFFAKFSNTTVNKIIKDSSGIIWIATDGGGVIRINPYKKKFNLLSHQPNETNSLSINFPKGLLIDTDNNLWVTTIGGGVNSYNFEENTWKRYLNNPSDPYSISHNMAQAIIEDKNGTLWFGTSNSLDTFDRAKNHFVRAYESPIGYSFISEDFNGNLWFSGNKDVRNILSRFDINSREFTFINSFERVEANYIYNVHQFNDSIFALGTNNGLYFYNYKQDSFTSLKNEKNNLSSLSQNDVISLLVDENNTLWVGTRNGLNKFIPESQSFIRYTEENGLPNSFIYGILSDRNGNLWISTNRGLSRMNIETEEIRTFTIYDGLQSLEFNTNSFFRADNGMMVFGGIGGINYFHPDSLQDNINLPRTVITNIRLFDLPYLQNQDIAYLDEIRLKYHENTLSFDFAGLEYTNPKLNQFAYMLEGVDTAWVYSSTRNFARYANLMPGTYIFHVKSSNNDGIWNDVPTKLKIIIAAPFYMKAPFIIFSIFFSLLMIYLLVKFRIKNIEKQNIKLENLVVERTQALETEKNKAELQSNEILRINNELEDLLKTLEERVKFRTEELSKANFAKEELLRKLDITKKETLNSIIQTQEQERSRIAKELHDSVGQYLTVLKFNMNNMFNVIKNADDIDKSRFESVNLIEQVVEEIRTLSYKLMPVVLQRFGLIPALEDLVFSIKASGNITIESYFDEFNPRLNYNIEINLFRIIQELINNTLKHSSATLITLQLLNKGNIVHLMYEDNGVGFDVKGITTGMGLINIYGRAELLNAEILIESSINNGTFITIDIPLTLNQENYETH